jgi:molybdopterin molybdotransferase
MQLLKVDTVKEVKEKLKAYFDAEGFRPPSEIVGLRDAVHRYLAEEIYSDTDIPQFQRSVVDGYAVMAKDTFGTGESAPVFLNVAGEVEMGRECTIVLQPGQAVYVPTGGMLPAGADAVVMIEFVEHLDERTIAVYRPSAPNSGIMNRGDDFKKDQLLFRRGHRINVKDVGMLAAIGKDRVSVFKKPRVSILSTGDEIVDITKTPSMGEVRDINSYTIAAFAEATGAEILSMSKAPDVEPLLKAALEAALSESDIVLLSGGSSAGSKDMTAAIIDSIGKPGVVTHGIAMKPGKPTIIGVIENGVITDGIGLEGSEKTEGLRRSKLVVGLPGHPMAAIVAYDVIVNDFMRKYCFHNEEEPIRITAKITENIHAGEGRETYQLVSLTKLTGAEWIAVPIHAKSGSISQLMMADGYVKISSLSEGVKADSGVEVTLIGR